MTNDSIAHAYYTCGYANNGVLYSIIHCIWAGHGHTLTESRFSQSCHKDWWGVAVIRKLRPNLSWNKIFQNIILYYVFNTEKVKYWLWEDFIYRNDPFTSISSFTGNTILNDRNAVSHRYSKRIIECGWRKWSRFRVPTLDVLNCVGRAERYIMMTSSNGKIFRVTGPLCGEFTGLRWIPLTNASDAELWSASWINGWVNKREAGGLRRHRAHYDVIVMSSMA